MEYDKRSIKRWNLTAPLAILANDQKTLVGHALDISIKGMKICSAAPIPVKKHFTFWVNLPAENSQQSLIRLVAQSVWADQDSNLFYTGFQFLALPSEAVFAIQRLIDESASVD